MRPQAQLLKMRLQWPLPYNVITGHQIANMIALFGWSLLFPLSPGRINTAAYEIFDQIASYSLFWATIPGGLAWLAIFAMVAPNGGVTFWAKWTVIVGSSFWWAFVALAFVAAIGINTGTPVYTGLALGGIWELVRLIRAELGG